MDNILANHLIYNEVSPSQIGAPVMPGVLSKASFEELKKEAEERLKRSKAQQQLRTIANLAQNLLLNPTYVRKILEAQSVEDCRAVIRRGYEVAAIIVDEGREWVEENYPELFSKEPEQEG